MPVTCTFPLPPPAFPVAGTDAASPGTQNRAGHNGYLKRKIILWKLPSLYSQARRIFQLVPLNFLQGYFSSAGLERFVLQKQIPALVLMCCLAWSNQLGSIKSSAISSQSCRNPSTILLSTGEFRQSKPAERAQLFIFITVLIINPRSFFRT